jgi:hypothetical protein
MFQVQLAISGQYAENYAAFDWDGKGECPQGWKQKFTSPDLMVCNVNITDLPEVMLEISERMEGMSWRNDVSSCYYDEIIVMPNRLAESEFIEWEYAAFDEITSISKEAIQEFIREWVEK